MLRLITNIDHIAWIFINANHV